MDRKKLIDLFKNGMEYPVGKHHFWISRCFEITVGSNQVVELNEYESFSNHGEPDSSETFHVGRSVLHLKEGKIVEETGDGWGLESDKSKKTLDII